MNPFDSTISTLVNQFAHESVTRDLLIVYVSNSRLLKGGVIVALVWWAWFRYPELRRREGMLAALMATIPALVVTRILELAFLRPRPFNEPGLTGFRPPYDVEAALWEGTSSFPSDHAALFYALAAAIFLVSRRAGWFAIAYVSLVICLPRVYIGEHYASDILVGAGIAIGLAWLANRPWVRTRLTAWPMRWLETRPGQFYAFAFLSSYIVVELFEPLINLAEAAVAITQGQIPPPRR